MLARGAPCRWATPRCSLWCSPDSTQQRRRALAACELAAAAASYVCAAFSVTLCRVNCINVRLSFACRRVCCTQALLAAHYEALRTSLAAAGAQQPQPVDAGLCYQAQLAQAIASEMFQIAARCPYLVDAALLGLMQQALDLVRRWGETACASRYCALIAAAIMCRSKVCCLHRTWMDAGGHSAMPAQVSRAIRPADAGHCEPQHCSGGTGERAARYAASGCCAAWR